MENETKPKLAAPSIDRIVAFENGEMDTDAIVEFFQDLIDSGMAWQLQGSYGRGAQELIKAGLCHA